MSDTIVINFTFLSSYRRSIVQIFCIIRSQVIILFVFIYNRMYANRKMIRVSSFYIDPQIISSHRNIAKIIWPY